MRWPGHFPAGVTLNGIVAHEDWLPTFAAIAGDAGINDKLKAGVELNGRRYHNYIDGYDQLDYLTGRVKQSPRREFIYVNDEITSTPATRERGRAAAKRFAREIPEAAPPG